MLNKDTISVLKEINGMTNSIILKYPHTVAVSDSQDMMVLFDVSTVDTDSFESIGFKNSLSNFLSLLSLFDEERDISLNGNTIEVESGSMSSSFITDNIALMDAYDRDSAQFDRTAEVPSVATFDLDVSDIKNIKSSSGVFKDLSEVIFESVDGDMKISLGATNKFNAKSNTFSITKPAQTSKQFQIKIPVENFKTLPLSEYNVQVKYNSSRDSYRILMNSNSLQGFKIILTVKV